MFSNVFLIPVASSPGGDGGLFLESNNGSYLLLEDGFSYLLLE